MNTEIRTAYRDLPPEVRRRRICSSRLFTLRSLANPTAKQMVQAAMLAALFPRALRCAKGHPYPPDGGRCKTCQSAVFRRWYVKNRSYFKKREKEFKRKHGYCRTSRARREA